MGPHTWRAMAMLSEISEDQMADDKDKEIVCKAITELDNMTPLQWEKYFQIARTANVYDRDTVKLHLQMTKRAHHQWPLLEDAILQILTCRGWADKHSMGPHTKAFRAVARELAKQRGW